MMRQIRRLCLSRDKWPLAGLIAVVLLVYANAYSGHFLLDDEFLIQKNLWIRSWKYWGKLFTTSSTGGAGGVDDFYRPMQTLAYLVVYQLGGLTPAFFHALNISLHAANAILIYLLGLAFGLTEVWAFFSALLWAVHPLHTEAITYMSATADPMYAFFCLLTCWLMIRFESRWTTVLAVVTAALGLLSKESAAVVPALVMIVLAFKHRRWNLITILKRAWRFWALLAGYLTLRATALNFRNSFDLYPTPNIYTEHILVRFYTFLATLPTYARLLIFPEHLHMERAFPVFTSPFHLPVGLGLLILLVALWILWRGWRTGRPWMWLAPAWFFVAHSSQSGVVVPVNALILEHWMYLPSVGLFWVLGHEFEETARNESLRRGLVLTVLLLACIWGGITFKQNRVWQNPIVFYKNVLHFEVGDTRIENNLGMAYSDRNDYVEAIQHYQTAIRLDPHSPNAYHNLGLLYWRMGNPSEAIQELQQAVKVDPHFYQSMLYLAKIYDQIGNKEKAGEYRRQYENVRRQFPASNL